VLQRREPRLSVGGLPASHEIADHGRDPWEPAFIDIDEAANRLGETRLIWRRRLLIVAGIWPLG
jgi:hypothetical protein